MATPQSKNLSSSNSPSPSKPTNPRNSEISNPMRRSFTGNPFAKQQPSIVPNQRSGFNPNTPANSPSDYPRRNSIGRESVVVSFRDCEDKENSKDQKSTLGSLKSPASLKGTKNFMSPTISAASKINKSPRKKILTERNDSVRTSFTFSNRNGPLKEDYSDFNQEKGLNRKKEVSFNPTVTYLEDKEEEVLTSNEDFDSVVNSINTIDDSDSFLESLAVENDFVNLDPSFKISPRTFTSSLPSPALAPLDAGPLPSPALAPLDADPLPSPALAPLDADPLMAPYDPKTNYLSPRPRFLHYKPNPRVQLYLKQRDGKDLEESFTSESSSDAEITEPETISDESSLDSHIKSADAASADVETEEEKEEEKEEEREEEDEEEEEEELLVSEPNPVATFEGAVVARKVSKRHFLTRPKFTALLFVLALAGLWASVSNSPIMDPSVLNNLNFPNLYVPPEISDFTRENLEGLAQKFRQWLYDSLSYIHNLVTSFREWRKPGRLQFANLTILLEDSAVDNYLMLEHSTFVADVMYKQSGEADANSLKEEDHQPIEADEKVECRPEIVDEEIVEGDEGHDNEARESNEEVADDKGQESEYEEAIMVPHSFEVSAVGILPEPEAESMTTQIDEANDHSNLATGLTQKRVDIAEITPLLSAVGILPEPELESMTTQIDEANDHSNLGTELTQKGVDIAEFTEPPSNLDVAEESIVIVNAETEPEVSSPEQPLAENVVRTVEADVAAETVVILNAKTEPEVSGLEQHLAENVASPVEIESTTAEFKTESLDSDAVTIEAQIPESVDMTDDVIKNQLSRHAVIGIISLTILSLLAVVPFMYLKNRTPVASNAAVTADQVSIAKTADHTSPLSVTTGNTFQQTDVHTNVESCCPSEMSSFLYSSSYSKREQRGTSEAQSQERRPRSNSRRESMASSDCSMGSESYGSFTTYEKIQSKHGNTEAEFLTPVRRSTRIRKQVTSP